MDLRFFSLFVGLILVTGLFSSPIAFAIEASGPPGDPTDDPMNPIPNDDNKPDEYTIDRPIVYNPDKGPWIKKLLLATEGATSMKLMSELLTVTAPSPPIADWHQIIMPAPGTGSPLQTAKWVECIDPSSGMPIPPSVSGTGFAVPGMIMSSPGTGFTDDVVWFDFPEVSAPGMFLVTKCFELLVSATSIPYVEIHQWPTIRTMAVGGEFIPIDATAVLIAGAQSNTLSILAGLMVIGAVAFGALYVSVKRKQN